MPGSDRPEVKILAQTAAWVAVAKPVDTAVHRGWAEDAYPMLQRVRDAIGVWVYPVHRLDRATSGVLLFALSSEHAKTLAEAFRVGTVDKHYLALVRGRTPERGHIDHPVPRSTTKGAPRIDAVTDFVRLAVVERFSWVAVQPRTGRLHQIRRHLKHLSHPLVGDVRYGKGDINRYFRAAGLHRLALHALRLSFPDPEAPAVSGARCTVTAPLPPDLADPLVGFGFSPTELVPEPWPVPKTGCAEPSDEATFPGDDRT